MKTNLIVFEGVHGVGKTTLLNELGSEKGVLNLYGDTSIWDNIKSESNLESKDLYLYQFATGVKQKLHFLKIISETEKYHTILIDRWYMSSLFWGGEKLHTMFDDITSFIEEIECELSKTFNYHTLVFNTSIDNINDLDYNSILNISELEYINHISDTIKKIGYNKVTEIFLKKNGLIFDIKEQFINFVENKQ